LQGRKKRQSSTGVSFPNIFPTTDEFQQAEQSAIEESLIPNQKELNLRIVMPKFCSFTVK
jgi:hypothetical protein